MKSTILAGVALAFTCVLTTLPAAPSETLLINAVREGNVEDVRMLINELKMPVNQQDVTQNTALHWAVMQVGILSPFLPNYQTKKDTYREIITELITAGADLTIKNNLGQTPADIAASSGLSELSTELTPTQPGWMEAASSATARAWTTASDYAGSAAKWAGSWIPGRRSTSPQEERPMAFTQTREGSDERSIEIIEPEEGSK